MSPQRSRPRRLQSKRLKDVQRERVEWLVRGRIPRGEVVLLVGMDDTGKGVWWSQLAARLSLGESPTVDEEPKNVLILSVEDSIPKTIAPRLDAAEADGDRIHFLTLTVDTEEGELEGMLTLPDDLHLLAEFIEANDINLVVIDPVFGYTNMRRIDINSEQMRDLLGPLANMCHELRCSVLGVVHLNKDEGKPLKMRIMAATALRAGPRSILALVQHPNEPDHRILDCIKHNLAATADTEPLEFQMQVRELEIDGHQVTMPYLELLGQSKLTAEEALEKGRSKDAPALDEASQLLRDVFAEADGPLAAADVIATAKAMGITTDTLHRARKSEGIVSRREGFGKGSKVYWHPYLAIKRGNGAESGYRDDH